MRFSVRRSVAAIALAVVASACGSDSSVAPVTQTTTLEQAFGELSFSDLGLTAAFSGADGIVPEIPSLVPSSCAYTATSQSFVCPTLKLSGVNVAQSYALLSGAGTPQSAFDPATTAAVRTTTSLNGTVSAGGSSATLQGTQTLTLSGLITGPHVLDGSGTTHISTTASSGSAALPGDLLVSTTIDKLVLPKSSASLGVSSWPASGTIIVSTTTSFTGLPDESFRVQLTFNGTSKVSVVFTADGVTDHCTMDLASAEPTCS